MRQIRADTGIPPPILPSRNTPRHQASAPPQCRPLPILPSSKTLGRRSSHPCDNSRRLIRAVPRPLRRVPPTAARTKPGSPRSIRTHKVAQRTGPRTEAEHCTARMLPARRPECPGNGRKDVRRPRRLSARSTNAAEPNPTIARVGTAFRILPPILPPSKTLGRRFSHLCHNSRRLIRAIPRPLRKVPLIAARTKPGSPRSIRTHKAARPTGPRTGAGPCTARMLPARHLECPGDGRKDVRRPRRLSARSTNAAEPNPTIAPVGTAFRILPPILPPSKTLGHRFSHLCHNSRRLIRAIPRPLRKVPLIAARTKPGSPRSIRIHKAARPTGPRTGARPCTARMLPARRPECPGDGRKAA